MATLTRDQQEALQKRMDELLEQLQRLDTTQVNTNPTNRALLNAKLTHEWIECHRKLRDGKRL
jgi:hypothetical protein